MSPLHITDADAASAECTPTKFFSSRFEHNPILCSLDKKRLKKWHPSFPECFRNWGIIVDWYAEITFSSKSVPIRSFDTFCGALFVLHRLFSERYVVQKNLQRVAAACLYVSWKQHEVEYPTTDYMCLWTAERSSHSSVVKLKAVKDMQDTEILILNTINFDVPCYTIWTAIEESLRGDITREEIVVVKHAAVEIAKLFGHPSFRGLSMITLGSITLLISGLDIDKFDIHDEDSVLQFMEKNEDVAILTYAIPAAGGVAQSWETHYSPGFKKARWETPMEGRVQPYCRSCRRCLCVCAPPLTVN